MGHAGVLQNFMPESALLVFTVTKATNLLYPTHLANAGQQSMRMGFPTILVNGITSTTSKGNWHIVTKFLLRDLVSKHA